MRTEYGTLSKKVYKTRVYDEFTGRMTRQPWGLHISVIVAVFIILSPAVGGVRELPS